MRIESPTYVRFLPMTRQIASTIQIIHLLMGASLLALAKSIYYAFITSVVNYQKIIINQ